MKKKWLGFGLALFVGTMIAGSNIGTIDVLATSTSNPSGNTTGTTGGTNNQPGGTAPRSTASSVENNARFTVDGTERVVTENLNPNKYPKDFTETQVECKGKKYKGLKYTKADLQMICLLNQKNGTAAYYIYQDSDQSVYPFIRIENGNDYIIAMPPFMMGETQVPSGYTQTELEFEKGSAQVYQTGDGTDSYLIYAMNQEGNKEWYEYNSSEKKYQPYQTESTGEESEQITEEPQEEENQVSNADKKYQELEKKYKSMKSKYRLMIAVFIVIIALFAIILVNTLIKRPGNFRRDKYEFDDEAYDDEDDLYGEYEDDEIKEMDERPKGSMPETFDEEIEGFLEEEPVKKAVSRKAAKKAKEKTIRQESISEEPIREKEEHYEKDIEVLDLNDL
ncbi:MAG: hypothetical protein HFI37_06830 [Lachnospiraceae bacterium]|nr:hypothetical protein [Lachnospiraceae bacterium]